uniref:Fido domain-containing protein n=1 Tax=Ditylenchus dipsaci TaxID=166011 RepID=A0A915EU54_9BILA
MESYQRPFLEPTNSYMRNLCENNPNFLLDRGSRTTDMSDLWLSLKPDEINPEIITTDELYEIHRVCYEHESKQFLDPKYLKAGDDVQKASRIRAQILPHLNKKENEQLKRLDSARDALCQKISTVVNWKELIYRIYCKDVTEMVQPGTTAEIPITLEDVCTLLSEGLLPMIGGRHKLEDSSLERDSDEKTPATGQAPTHTMDAERRQLVGNIAKAYARVLTTTDVPLNEYYLTNLHYTLFEKTEQAKDGGAIGHGKYDKLNEGVTWIGEQMKGSEVDKVTLAAMGALTAFVVHPFADGNTQVSQLFQTSILVRAGYPPSRTEVIEFEKCVTEFTNKSRDPRHFVRHMINSLEHTIVEACFPLQ